MAALSMSIVYAFNAFLHTTIREYVNAEVRSVISRIKIWVEI